jgi:hypothetical protein
MSGPLYIPSEADVLLREWAFYFRDRRGQRGTCWSLEGKYRKRGDEIGEDAWDSAPRDPAPETSLLRALATHEVVKAMPLRSKWSVTYHFCYPHLERWQVLMFLKRWLGYRVSWKEHEEAVDFGRIRVVSKMILDTPFTHAVQVRALA